MLNRIRDPATFQILLDTIARLVREKLIPREREVTETDEIPADILAEMRRMERGTDHGFPTS